MSYKLMSFSVSNNIVIKKYVRNKSALNEGALGVAAKAAGAVVKSAAKKYGPKLAKAGASAAKKAAPHLKNAAKKVGKAALEAGTEASIEKINNKLRPNKAVDEDEEFVSQFLDYYFSEDEEELNEVAPLVLAGAKLAAGAVASHYAGKAIDKVTEDDDEEDEEVTLASNMGDDMGTDVESDDETEETEPTEAAFTDSDVDNMSDDEVINYVYFDVGANMEDSAKTKLYQRADEIRKNRESGSLHGADAETMAKGVIQDAQTFLKDKTAYNTDREA